MCTQVFITEDGPNGTGTLETVAELRAYGIEVIDGEDWQPEDGAADAMCLCGVNVEAVLRRSGRDFWWDPFGYALFESPDWTEGPNLKGTCSECGHPDHTGGVCGAPHPQDPTGAVLPGCTCHA